MGEIRVANNTARSSRAERQCYERRETQFYVQRLVLGR